MKVRFWAVCGIIVTLCIFPLLIVALVIDIVIAAINGIIKFVVKEYIPMVVKWWDTLVVLLKCLWIGSK